MLPGIKLLQDSALHKIKRAKDVRNLKMIEDEYLGRESELSQSAKMAMTLPPESARQAIIDIEKARKLILKEIKKKVNNLS